MSEAIEKPFYHWGRADSGSKMHAIKTGAEPTSFCGVDVTAASIWAAAENAPEDACGKCLKALR